MRTRSIKHQNGNQNKLLNRVTKVALLAMLFVMSFSVMISGMIDGTFLSADDIFSKIDSAVTGNPQDDNSSNIAEAASPLVATTQAGTVTFLDNRGNSDTYLTATGAGGVVYNGAYSRKGNSYTFKHGSTMSAWWHSSGGDRDVDIYMSVRLNMGTGKFYKVSSSSQVALWTEGGGSATVTMAAATAVSSSSATPSFSYPERQTNLGQDTLVQNEAGAHGASIGVKGKNDAAFGGGWQNSNGTITSANNLVIPDGDTFYIHVMFNSTDDRNTATTSKALFLDSMSFSATPVEYSGGGNGDVNNPFVLKNRADFDLLSLSVNGGSSIINGYAGKYFKVVPDNANKHIDMGASLFTPIGTWAMPFKGIFDGNNSTLDNLNINKGGGNEAGLFGCVGTSSSNAGTDSVAVNISNLTINGNISGGNNVGGLIGYLNKPTGNGQATIIANITNNATINGGTGVGGIIGMCWADPSSGQLVIENCKNFGSVTGSGNDVGGIVGRTRDTQIKWSINGTNGTASTVRGANNIGGIVGSFAGGYFHANGSAICTNYMAVTGNENVGGLVGYASWTSLTSGVNNGSVYGNGNFVAGIVGRILKEADSLILSGVSNTGSVNGNSAVGGIVGQADTTVSGCSNTGAITSRGTSKAGGGTAAYLGGIAGLTYGDINHCYNGGRVAVSSKYSYSNVVAGIVGQSTSTISYCANTGEVSGSEQVGGIVGYKTSDISYCYNTGAITKIHNSGWVGGVIGENHSGAVTACWALYTGDKPTAEGGINDDGKGLVALNYLSVGYQPFLNGVALNADGTPVVDGAAVTSDNKWKAILTKNIDGWGLANLTIPAGKFLSVSSPTDYASPSYINSTLSSDSVKINKMYFAAIRATNNIVLSLGNVGNISPIGGNIYKGANFADNELFNNYNPVLNVGYYYTYARYDSAGTTPITNIINAGTYKIAIVVRGGDPNGQALGIGAKTEITISKRSITITAGSQTITYRDSAQPFTFSVANLPYGIDKTFFDGKINLTTNYATGNNKGNYYIRPSWNTGVSADSNYTITYVDGTLTVSPKDISGLTVTVTSGAFTFNNGYQTLQFTVTWGDGTTLVLGADFVVVDEDSDANTNTGKQKNAGNYTLKLSGTNNYTGLHNTTSWTINKKDITNDGTITINNIGNPTYNHTPQTVGYDVWWNSIATLYKGTDYTATGDTETNAGTYTFTITGIVNYEGTKSASWTMNRKSIGDSNIVIAFGSFPTYNATEQTVPFTVKWADGTLLYDTTPTNDFDVLNKSDKGTNASLTQYTYNLQLQGQGNYTGNKTAYWQINSCEVTLNSQATAGNTYVYTHQHQGVNTIAPQILLGNGRFGSLNFQTGENLATYFDVAYYRYCSGTEETAANGWIIDASGYGYRPIGANGSGVYTFKGNVEVGGLPRAINAVNVYGGDNGVGNNGYKIVFNIKNSLGDKANNYKFSTTGAGTQEAVALTRTATQYTYVWHITPFGLTVTPTATGRWQNAGWNGYIYHENAPHQGLNNVSINFFNGDIARNYIDVSYQFQNPTTSAWTDKTATLSSNTAYTFFADKASNYGAYKVVFTINEKVVGTANNYKFTTGANDHAISDGIDTYQTGKTVAERSLSYTWNITQYDFTKYSAINYTGLASGYNPDGSYINNNFNWYTQGVNGAYGVDNALNNGGTLFMVYNYDLSQTDFITKLLGIYNSNGNATSLGVLKFVLGADLDFLSALYADGGSITLTLDNYPTAGNNGVAYATFKITVNSGAGNKNFEASTLNLTAFILDGDFGKDTTGTSGTWGSETNPYLISHWAHLFRLSQISNGATPWDSVSGINGIAENEVQASNINYTGAYFKVTKDFTVTNALKTTGNWSAQTAVTNFKPIGASYGYIFNGAFDATSYKINLTISNYGGWAGLFGFVGGTISNVTVKGSVQSNGGYSAGIVAELSNEGIIRNCISSVTVSGGADYVGGIVGIAHSGSIIDCENRGAVSGTNDIGGIVGRLNNTTVSGCKNTGAVTGSGSNIGGIVGNIFSAIGSVNNSVSNTTQNSAAIIGINNVGGIVGRSIGAITNGANSGSVIASGNYVGGIVGYAENCDFSGSFTNTGYIEGNDYVGGIIGCYLTATARTWDSFIANNSCLQNATDFTNHGGDDIRVKGMYGGGIFGCIDGALTISGTGSSMFNSASIDSEKSYITDNQAGNTDGDSAIIGGIVGLNKGGILTAEMTVNIDTSRGNANADVGLFSRNNKATYSAYTGAFVGGIAGINTGTISNATISSAQIISIWLVGGAFVGGDYVGGIVGLNLNGVVSNCTLTANAVVGSVKNAATSAVTKFPAGQYSGGIVGRSVGGEISGTIYSGANVTGKNYVGGIVGYADGTVITLNAPTVTGVITGRSYVGALFGSAVGSAGGYQTSVGANKTWKDVPQSTDRNVVILGTNVTATISATGGTADTDGYIGGLAGYIGNLVIYADHGYTTKQSLNVQGNYVGGVIGCIAEGGALIEGKTGSVASEISNSHTLTVTGNYVGGIIGGIKAGAGVFFGAGTYILGYAIGTDGNTLPGAFINTGAITATGNYVGGIVGGTTVPSVGADITRFEISGQNKANITANVSAVAGDYVGGIIGGTATGFIAEFKNSNTYCGESSSTQITVRGKNYVGGLVGYLSANENVFEKVYSTAIVVGTGNYVGGIVGKAEFLRLNNSFVTLPDKTTKFSVDTSIVQGADYVGGLFGDIEKGSANNCYVQGFKFSTVTVTKGGLSGYAHPTEVKFTGSWAIYLAKDPTYQTVSANKNGKFVIAGADTVGGLSSFAEMSVMAGIRTTPPATPPSSESSASDNTTMPCKNGSISLKLAVPKTATNKLLVFYDVSGYDSTTESQIAMANDTGNGELLYLRIANDQESFSICLAPVIFQNIPSKGSLTQDAWKNIWVNNFMRPANDPQYAPNISGGPAEDAVKMTASGTITYLPFISRDKGAITKVCVGNFAVEYTKGSEATPNIINTLAEWREFCRKIQTNTAVGGYGAGQFYKLGDGWDNSNTIRNISELAGDVAEGETDMPQHYFSGTFDGNGKTINIELDQSAVTGNTKRLSLFPNAAGATFKNLTLAGFIKTRTDVVSEGYDVAGFVGKPFGNLSFLNCINKADITAQRLAAGIIGYTRNFTITMEDCVNEGNITTTEGPTWPDSKLMNEYKYGTGGIIAYVNNRTTIESCINRGNITGGVNVGGIVGKCDSFITINNSANTGVIWAYGANPTYGDTSKKGGLNVWSNAGGIIGFVGMEGALYAYACYNSGDIRGRGNIVGGIVGLLGTVKDEKKPHQADAWFKSEIKYCYNSARVSAGWTVGEGDQDGEELGSTGVKFTGSNAGGIVGVAVAVDIAYCYNTGRITSYGCIGYTFSWQCRTGGIVGESRAWGYNGGEGGHGPVDKSVYISYTYNTGEIWIAEGGSACRYSAGIVGYMEDGTAKNSTHVTDANVFSLHWQVKYVGKGWYDWNINGGEEQWMKNGTVLSSKADLTAAYSGATNKIAPSATVVNAFGESSSQSLIKENGEYKTANDLKANPRGYIYMYGCLPQLAVFALDTKSSLSMLAKNYGADQYGNYQGSLAGSEVSPYIIKDGLDMLALSALVNATGNSSNWHGTNKYIEFANEHNNTNGDITGAILMPTTGTAESLDYQFINKKNGVNEYGKSSHLYLTGAVKGMDPGDLSPNNLWKAKNYYFDGANFVNQATQYNTNFYPIGMYGGDSYFGGHLFGGYSVKDSAGAVTAYKTEVVGLNIRYTRSNGDVYAGLFGRTQNADIRDFAIAGSVTGWANSTKNAFVGGFVGFSGGGTNLSGLQAGGTVLPSTLDSQKKLEVSVKNTDTTYSKDGNVGGIVGRATTNIYSQIGYATAVNGTVSNIKDCVSYANVTGFKQSIGGIFGNAGGRSKTSIFVTNCKVPSGTICCDVLSTSNAESGSYIGGIGGSRLKDTDNDAFTLAFVGCSVGDSAKNASADTSGHKVVIRGENIVGGIIGNVFADTTFRDCAVYGDVIISKKRAIYWNPSTTQYVDDNATNTSRNDATYGSAIGGIVGVVDGKCVVDGNTKFVGLLDIEFCPENQEIKNIGGIYGFMGSGADIGGTITVKGTINIKEDKTGGSLVISPNKQNIGGIAGASSTASYKGNFNIAPTINAKSAINVGGFIGLNEGTCTVVSGVTINIGKAGETAGGGAAADTTAKIVGGDNVGGFIGLNQSIMDIGAETFAGVPYQGQTLIYNYASIDGRSALGGFVGSNSGTGAVVNIYGDKINGNVAQSVSIVTTGTIGTNLDSKGSIIDCTNASASRYIGGVFGLNSVDATINSEKGSNIENKGQVGINKIATPAYTYENSYQYYVGGIIGSSAGGFGINGAMTNSGSVYGYQYVGGSIGNLEAGTIAGLFSNTGTVTGVKSVGGVVGEVQFNATIGVSTLSNTGTVTGTPLATEPSGDTQSSTKSGTIVGGIVGAFYGTIAGANQTDGVVSFANSGAVKAKNYAGGIIGLLTGSVVNAKFVNSGTLTFSGGDGLGGSIGIITSDPKHTDKISVTNTRFEYVAAGGTSAGETASTTELTATGTSTTNIGGVGGVIGLIDTAQINSAVKWSGNTFYVNGNVTAINAQNVGGVIGKIDKAYITISNMLAYGNKITGNSNVGGIVGNNGSTAPISLTNCYNVRGEVVSTATTRSDANVGGIVGLGGSSQLEACYWIVEFKNKQLQQADENNLNTANMDRHIVAKIPTGILYANEVGYIAGFTGSTLEQYLTFYKREAVVNYNNNYNATDPLLWPWKQDVDKNGVAINCLESDLVENNGEYVFYTEKAGQTQYSTGKPNTGFYFAYANDAYTSSLATENINTKHAQDAQNPSDLDFWKYIAQAYSTAEIAAGKNQKIKGSAITLDKKEAEIGYIYATAMAGNKNGAYLYVGDSATEFANKAKLKFNAYGKGYLEIDSATSGNVLLFYKELAIGKPLTYNGVNRYAPIEGLVGYLVPPTTVLPKVGSYYYVLENVADKNIGLEVGKYGTSAKIYYVYGTGNNGNLVQEVGHIESDGTAFMWEIKQRKLEATASTSSSLGADGTYQGHYNYHININIGGIVARDFSAVFANGIRFGFVFSDKARTQIQPLINKAFPDFLENKDGTTAETYIYWRYDAPTAFGKDDNTNNVMDEATYADLANVYTYQFRIYYKNAGKYTANVASKTEPKTTEADTTPRQNYSFTALSAPQELTITRAKIEVSKNEYLQGTGGDTYTVGAQQSPYDGFEHGIRFTFTGFRGREFTDNTISKAIIDEINKVIELKMDNSILGKNQGKHVANTLQLRWTANKKGTYNLAWAKTDLNTSYGNNYYIDGGADSWTISDYVATVTWGWSGNPSQEYNGYSTDDKAIQYTATVWGNTNVTNLTAETWGWFIQLINASLTDGGATNRVTITAPYLQGQRFRADIVFKGRNAKEYTATVKSNDSTAATGWASFIIEPVSHRFTITPKALIVSNTKWSTPVGSGTDFSKSYTYNTYHQGLTSVSFGGLVGEDLKNDITHFISFTDKSTTTSNRIEIITTNDKFTISNTANAGSYGISFAMNNTNPNYTFDVVEYSWTIAKLALSADATNNNLTFNYDGNWHKLVYKWTTDGITGANGTTYGNDRIDITVSYPENATAGVCNWKDGGWVISAENVKVSAKRHGVSDITSNNYTVTTTGGKITIDRLPITVKWVGTSPNPADAFSYVYSGSIQSPTATASGTVPNETITFNLIEGKINVGAYTAQLSANTLTAPHTIVGGQAKLSNYIFAAGEPTTHAYAITPKEITVNFGDTTSFIYNGKYQMPTITAVGAVGGETITLDNTTVHQVNAGKGYDASVSKILSVTGGQANVGNYKLSGTLSTKFDINPLTLTIVWHGGDSQDSFTFIYDANQHSLVAMATNAPNPESVAINVNGSYINVGSYTANASGFSATGTNEGGVTKNSNYTLPSSSHGFTITERPLTVTINSRGTRTYKTFDEKIDFATAYNTQNQSSSRSNNFRLGQGFTVDGFAIAETDRNIKIVAVFNEVLRTRKDFDSYINGVKKETNGTYTVGNKYYKMLVFEKTEGASGASTNNYTFSIKVGESVIADQNDTASKKYLKDSLAVENPTYNLSISIEQKKINVGYDNTVQSYVNKDNGFKQPSEYIDVTCSNTPQVDVVNGWKKLYKQYTTINGKETGTGSEILGASLHKDELGKYINYKLMNQPTLIIGYFVDQNGYLVATLSDLLLANFYYQMNFNPSIGTAVKYKWQTVCTLEEYTTGTGAIPPVNGVTYATWEEYFTAYETWYNSPANTDKIAGTANIEIILNDAGTEYGFYKAYKHTLQTYFKFVQSNNISGIMTQQDFDILNEQFAGVWGSETGNLANIRYTKVGSVVTAIGGVFAGSVQVKGADGISREVDGFAGVYDGNGYVIDNLNIIKAARETVVSTYNVGFIENLIDTVTLTVVDKDGVSKDIVTQGTVKNVNIRNAQIDVYDYLQFADIINAGGIVGSTNALNAITNCSFHGAIRAHSTNPNATFNLGGIVGLNNYNAVGGATGANSINNVMAVGSITAYATKVNAGGIVGNMANGINISNALSTVEIYSEATSNNIGGIVGIYSDTAGSGSAVGGRVAYIANSVVNANGGKSTVAKAIGNQASVDTLGLTYTAMRAKTSTAYDGTGKFNSALPLGEFDVIDNISYTGINPYTSLRLGDIIDIYVLQYKLTLTGVSSADNGYFVKSASKLVGDKIGTETSQILVENEQQFELLRLFRFASFQLVNNITYYPNHVGTVFEGVFYGSFKRVDGSAYTVNLRKGSIALFDFVVAGAIQPGIIIATA